MKQLFLSVLVIVALALAGCSQAEPEEQPRKVDLSKQRAVTLEAIQVAGGSASANAAATRAGTQPLAEGTTFRLYAFEKGSTDMGNLLATRKYVITDDKGTAEIADEQESLYLPVGEVDIYLVSPAEAVVGAEHPTAGGKTVLIAGESGVYPCIGVDLTASKTPITVRDNDANAFTATPLAHKMSQVETRIVVPDDAPYTDFELTKVIMTNQAVDGTFTFGDDGGKITRSGTRVELTLDNVQTAEKHKSYFVNSLLMPAELVNMNISIYFSCKLGEQEVADKRMNSSVTPYELPAGKKVVFTSAPLIATELLFTCGVQEWDEVNMGDIQTPVQDGYLFWYDGNDAPVTKADGRRYWIDRSGNGLDAELIGEVEYNAAEKYYYVTNPDYQNNYISIPALGYVNPYTCEVVASTVKADGQSNGIMLFSESEENQNSGLSLQVPNSDGSVYFDGGGNVAGSYRLSCSGFRNDPRIFEDITTWGFVRTAVQGGSSAGRAQIWRNGSPVVSEDGMQLDYGNFNYNRLFGAGCSGVKLYGVRMSKQALPAAQIAQNAANDRSRYYGVNNDATQGFGYPTEPLKNGLILDLRGTNGPETVNGKTVWRDVSPSANHAEIFGTGITYTAPYYLFTGTSGDYMKLIHSLGTHQEFTLEMVAVATEPSTTVINFGPNELGDNSRSIAISYQLNGNVYFISPFAPQRQQVAVAVNNLPAPIPKADIYTKQFQVAVTRKQGAKGMVGYINGTAIGASDISALQLGEMLHCFIGCNKPEQQMFNKQLYAVRLYNRVLTEKELQYNYEYDKGAYNILP